MISPKGTPHNPSISRTFFAATAAIALILLCILVGIALLIGKRNGSVDSVSSFGTNGYVRSASY
ncbi:MAG: hypothetical protein J6W70_07550, partial [Lentisphaeria bacterium]|nr:hypothetical protein [Lentisphaeria bacterium]